MTDPQTFPDDEPGPRSAVPQLASFVLYAVTVGVAATGLGLLARRELSSVNGFVSESGLVLTVIVVGLLGGIAGERAHWFGRR